MGWTDQGNYVTSAKSPLQAEWVGSPEETKTVTSVDLRGVPSPVKLLRANSVLVRGKSNEQFAFCTSGDPQDALDFNALAKVTGHALLKEAQDEQGCWFLFQRR